MSAVDKWLAADPLAGLRGASESRDDELMKYTKAKQLRIFPGTFAEWLNARGLSSLIAKRDEK